MDPIASIEIIAYTNSMDYLDEVMTKYDALEKAVIGQGSILDILPLRTINDVVDNVTSQLPPHLFVMHVPEERITVNATAAQLIIFGYFTIVLSQRFEL